MAKKDRARTGNARPTESYKNRTLYYYSPPNVACGDGEAAASATGTLTNIIRYNHFEVGNGSQSSFSGTDSYGQEIKNATFHEREPLYMRYNYVRGVDDYVDGDTSDLLDNVLSSEYFYDQDSEEEGKSKSRIPKWEKQIRPFITYDEEYFQHVYNWPTAHTLKPRKVGGFIEEKEVCQCPPDVGGTSTTYTVYPVSTTFSGDFSLDKTRSEIYWIEDDWTYRKLNFDPISGEIVGDEDAPQSNVSATIEFEFEWDDNPNTAGTALKTVEWTGSSVSFEQSGEKGSDSETVTLSGGDYKIKLVDNQGGFGITSNKKGINFYDKDGTDANAQVRITVTSTSGNGVTVEFDKKGNLTIKGTPTNTPSTDPNSLTSKIGRPVLYHGGTDDNSIFFNYLPENITTNSTNKNSTIEHIFDDPANTTNSLTSSNSDVTITPQSVADLGGGDDSEARKHYTVNISGVNIASASDINITVNSNLSASGLTQSNFEVSRIKLISSTEFKVWFKTHSGVNSFVRGWSVSFGKPASQDFGSTTKLLAIGDTVNGATITNIVNYVVDVALKRTVSASSNKNAFDAGITESQFLAFGGTSTSYAETNGWLHLNAVNDLVEGMQVFGDGIKDGTKITGVDSTNNIIYISKRIQTKKIKTVKFSDTAVNRVSTHTLCYATISGGSDFTADQTYTSNSGIDIKVRAGKGIINRSAVVGIYYSKNRKNIEYSPIFYSADDSCVPETDSDDNGDWVLGTVRWDDGSKVDNKYLMQSPKNEIAYKISAIYLAFTLAPIDRDTFKIFLAQYRSDKNIINLYASINAYAQSTLGGKRASTTYDDVCRDEIVLDYYKAYEPDLETFDIDTSVNDVIESINDECLLRFDRSALDEENINPQYTTIQSVQDRFAEVINNSISNSSFMSEEYHNKLVKNEDSLLNRLKNASKATMTSVPKTTEINNLPPAVEGSDNSGTRNVVESYRDLPPSMDRVKYYIEDLIIADDRFMSPNLDLDPGTTVNQPRIVIRSKPCWEWDDNLNNAITVSSGSVSGVINITVNTDSDGYVTNITTSPGAVSTSNANTFVGGTPATGVEGQPGYSPGTAATGCTYTVAWKTPRDKDDQDNLYIGERAESFGSGAYYESTNASLHPDLRDLDYKERNSDSDISAPDAFIYPRVLWEPNVSYQMDFYKTFWFRLNELTELVGETLLNLGNPYLDNPIKAKIMEDITDSTTSIKVDTTVGFLSSGYLIIPKYTKKIQTDENGNNAPYFSYSGEEIIYYGSKTDTSFDNLSRESLGSVKQQIITLPVSEIEERVRYKITVLGDTDWSKIGAGNSPEIGDVFVATKSGSGTGQVEVFASNGEKTPEPDKLFGAPNTPKLSVISSYEKGFSVAQHWVYRLKEV